MSLERTCLGYVTAVDGGKVTEFEIAGGPQAPQSARTKLAETFDDRLDGPVVNNMRLLVSELVTNCVVHGGADGAGGPIRVRAAVEDDCVRTEVCHDGPGFAAPSAVPDLDSPGGLGLFLVEQMSKAWGIEHSRETCVWFELNLAQAA